MEITSNYDITRLFTTKNINVYIDNKQAFTLIAKPIRDLVEDLDWNSVYHILTMNCFQWKELLQNQIDYSETLYYIQTLTIQLGGYKQYSKITENIEKYLREIIPGFKIDRREKTWKINDLLITPEIWNYVVYLLKLICGEKVQKPLVFSSPEEKAFFLKQQELENRIKKIKENADNQSSKDGLMKNILAITYSFPSLTIDYLFDQTMAQIHWLAKYAAQEVSYRVNAQAFAAGNMKKGSKLEFFIK